MNETEIQELKSALKEIIQMAITSGHPLSGELKSLLVQAMNHVATRIQELRQTESPADQLQPRKIEPALQQSMPSSNVYAFGYDPKTQRLLVKFQGDENEGQGPIYGYDNVPKVIFDLFQKGSVPARTDGKNKWGQWWKGKVPSIGASLHTLIKNGPYPYQKLS